MDLNILFSYREVKGSREKVISDKDLELLLDRSDLIGKYPAFIFLLLETETDIICNSFRHLTSLFFFMILFVRILKS